jgi:hypothetical protein
MGSVKLRLLGSSTLVLLSLVALPAGGQTVCARDGEWLTCADGRRYAIRKDPEGGPARGSWRAWPPDRFDPPRETSTTAAAPLFTQDGLACWPHGDHVHCR